MTSPVRPTPARSTPQVLELRQDTLHPGRRDALIELFDGVFVDAQEQTGMTVLGQFRDLDAPDRFVWLRAFPELADRASQLETFYGGPVWKAHRDAASATMIDSDDVLLLRPARADMAPIFPAHRDITTSPPDGGLVVATVYLLRAPVDDAFVTWFDARVAPIVAACGAPPLACYRTEAGANEFPKLPVRAGVHAFVWLTSFASDAAYRRYRRELDRFADWHGRVRPELEARLEAPAAELRLSPTARSLIRHVEPLGFTTHRTGEVHDFDFIAGEWAVTSRRLKARASGSDEWSEFAGTSRATAHLGGVVNFDEVTFPSQGIAGATVRSFDLAARQWTIHWIGSGTGTMDPGVVGGFHGDRGEFYGHDHDGAREVKVRFVWTKLGPDAARWEQAFSYDGGAWETNWIMEFSRTRG